MQLAAGLLPDPHKWQDVRTYRSRPTRPSELFVILLG